jgi:hypothetical protein
MTWLQAFIKALKTTSTILGAVIIFCCLIIGMVHLIALCGSWVAYLLIVLAFIVAMTVGYYLESK